MFRSDNNTLLNNAVSSNRGGGVILYMASNNTFVSNTVCSNRVGFDIGGSWNVFYRNVVGNNPDGNAVDDGVGSSWSVSGIGNYWSDYYGLGIYDIPGTGSATDYYPAVLDVDDTAPVVIPPPATEFGVDQSGREIIWAASDEYPAFYVIHVNTTLTVVDFWSGGTVSISADGWAIGTYNVTLMVHDAWGNSAVDTVWVRILSESTPTTPTTTTTTIPPTTRTTTTGEPRPAEPTGEIDMLYVSMLGGGAAAVLVALVLVFARRRRS